MAASMGMGREMIKWDEPIQAIDGRKARVIAHLPETPGDPNDPGFFTPTMVWVSSATNGFGDVILVNNRGVRCDDTVKAARCLLTEIGQPFIRNAPVTREGWVVKHKRKDGLWDTHIFSSAESARMAGPSGSVVVRMEWEE